jgi:DNA transposition AAA+ family ATPase
MSSSQHDAEDRLPLGQDYILTRNNRRFETFIGMLTDPTAPPTIGSITAKAGMGKTIAINKYMNHHGKEAFVNGLPTIARCKIPTNSTGATVARELLLSVGESPPLSGNKHIIAKLVSEAIMINGVKMIFVDESDRLNSDSFDVIRSVYDKSGCVFVIVGLPQILRVINKHEQFSSRVGLRMKFEPPTLDEVLDVILPDLVVPNWQYNVEDETDRTLGIAAWKMSGSFRRLRNLLDRAASLCRMRNEERIVIPTLEETFELVKHEEEDREAKKWSDGDLERESERRKRGKKKK